MKLLILLSSLISLTISNTSSSMDYGFDHAIILVEDIIKASDDFSDVGFWVKTGRLHDNGLLDAHIKFSNATKLELMSIKTKSDDKLNKNYARFLTRGEGGAYVAINMLNVKETSDLLNSAGLEHTVSDGNSLSYITFTNNPSLEHFFLIKSGEPSIYHDYETFNHKNGVKNINTIYVEGAGQVKKLLTLLGAKKCKGHSNIFNLTGTNFFLIPPISIGENRFLGIGANHSKNKIFNNISDIHGIWIKSSEYQCY